MVVGSVVASHVKKRKVVEIQDSMKKCDVPENTGMYSYDVWLWQVPLVVTVHMSADWDPQELWDKDNCFEVLLQVPSWIE